MVNALCSRELMDVLSAVMILAVATFTPEVRRLLSRLPLPLRSLAATQPAADPQPPERRPAELPAQPPQPAPVRQDQRGAA